LLLKKKPQATWSSEHFGEFLKKSSHLEEEESYEITKIFWEDLGRFVTFFF
jgi:hypothetical protein